ncbi:FAD:protein FMN transferase [Pontimicrobium aquaticum]|uniref:FAD:protein FMN transferase n=1 Tax=Pontimicrobium aquaticum TaxID=2565367 RepID=A0A4U0EWV9_9FLAO|nr:FAD:protein FMN transferase [Pontimicrobium aquaticum]TJY36457.1 FAD:protein FMN transferase [Pontimicrobium aquaticum]
MKNIFKYLLIILVITSCKDEVQNKRLTGSVFGTTYTIQFEAPESEINFQEQFDKLFYIVNKSMSTYQANSIISKINRNEEVSIDSHFRKVFDTSKDIYSATNGAFDPTIGVMVNAWDFGSDEGIEDLDTTTIDSLMLTVGFNKVKRENDKIIKEHEGTIIDFSAIAKGYGVDVIADFLDTQSVESYLVEIGGEIRTKGFNAGSGNPWKIGVESPSFDGSQTVMKAISLTDEAMATSGTYRKFKIDENGNKYAHIINPKTGYSSKNNVLSVSVIAKECMIADAYATALMTMTVDDIKDFVKKYPELKVFVIFENSNKELETLSLNGFPNE